MYIFCLPVQLSKAHEPILVPLYLLHDGSLLHKLFPYIVQDAGILHNPDDNAFLFHRAVKLHSGSFLYALFDRPIFAALFTQTLGGRFLFQPIT